MQEYEDEAIKRLTLLTLNDYAITNWYEGDLSCQGIDGEIHKLNVMDCVSDLRHEMERIDLFGYYTYFAYIVPSIFPEIQNRYYFILSNDETKWKDEFMLINTNGDFRCLLYCQKGNTLETLKKIMAIVTVANGKIKSIR